MVDEHRIASDTLVGMDTEGTGTENLLGAPDEHQKLALAVQMTNMDIPTNVDSESGDMLTGVPAGC
jgi:hypothetical protein